MKMKIFLSTVVSSVLIGTSTLYGADLNVTGSVNIETSGFSLGGSTTVYPSISMTADDIPPEEMEWILAIGNDTETDLSAVGFFNPLTGVAPFLVANDAVADMLTISKNSVFINANGLNEEMLGTLLVGGTINAIHDGPGTESVYKLLTLSARDTDGTGPSEAGFVLNNVIAGKEWLFRTIDDGTAFTATLGGTGGAEFKVTSRTGSYRGTELFLGNGATNLGGVWYNASSRALKENIKPLSTKEALTAFNKLQPVTYNYKTDKSEKVVGFIAEDVPALVAINSRDGLSSMDMVAVLTKVVQEQDKSLAETKSELQAKDAEMKARDQKIATMEARQKAQDEKIANLETIQRRVTQLESILTNLTLDTSNTKKEKVSFSIK